MIDQNSFSVSLENSILAQTKTQLFNSLISQIVN